MSRSMPRGLSALERRHPYIAAERLLVQGAITREQAAAMVAADPEFVAEYELSTLSVGDVHGRYAAALAVVLTHWVPRAVAYACEQKARRAALMV